VRLWIERRRPAGEKRETDPGILAASGLVAGEGLAGVLVAALVATGMAEKSRPPLLGGLAGELGALALIAAVGVFLYTAARGRTKPAT
jgi:hypothetical protein